MDTTTEHFVRSLFASGGTVVKPENWYDILQSCTQSLVHACQCREETCGRMSCSKVKRVVHHTKLCKKRVDISCPVCKKLLALCCFHSNHCTQGICSVPFCVNIRQKLTEKRLFVGRGPSIRVVLHDDKQQLAEEHRQVESTQ